MTPALQGCHVAFVGRAQVAYTDGRYLETAEELARREPELASLSRRNKARYGMYRGLALLQLRDYRGAERWLRYAAKVERQGRPTLHPRQRVQLDKGLAQIAQLRGR